MSFVTAEKLVNTLTDPATRASYQSALYKIKAVLRASDKELLDEISSRIEVVENAYLPRDRHQKVPVETILRCIAENRVIRIRYASTTDSGLLERTLEPVGIYANGAYWYLIAYCRLRDDYRNFRTDRVQAMEILDERFNRQHPSLQSFIDRTSREQILHKAVIRLDKSAYRYLGDQHYYHGFVSQTDAGEQIEMTFLTKSLNGLAHWFLMLGADADPVEPEELKDLILEKLENIRHRIYSKIPQPY